jgi:hypothetical protein
MWALCALALLPALPARAQDAADLAMWQSIAHSTNPAEYRAYLDTFPNGRFVELARLRAAAAPPQTTQQSPPAPVSPAQAAVAPSPAASVWVRPAHARVRLVDGVTLDIDARALRKSSNLRVAVVPVGTPDAIADLDAYLDASTSVTANRLHLTVPSGPPGDDEVRLYHIAPFADAPALAARASVFIAAGLPGATLARTLAREAARLGPVRFEANHRNRPLTVQGAFLNQQPRLAFDPRWLAVFGADQPAETAVAITIGMPGIAPDDVGMRGDVICATSADPGPTLDRLATLQVGDPVVVRGVPSIWSAASPADPIILKDCALAP